MKSKFILCLLSDFGTGNRFTGIMKGVACSIDPELKIFDISHEIEPYNITAAAYLLSDTIKYWPEGSVFAVVIDPGVGSDRRPVGILTKNNRYIICPDNGLTTVVEDEIQITEVRAINTELNILPGIIKSATFDGRDVFVYNAARLAAGKIEFHQLGFLKKEPLLRLDLPKPDIEGNRISGSVTYIEKPFGNLATNIKAELFVHMKWSTGKLLHVKLIIGENILLDERIIYVKTFSDVGRGDLLIYIDSEQRIGIARNTAPVDKEGLLNSYAGKLTVSIAGD